MALLYVYHSIVPFNDKEDCSNILLPLLEELGYVKVSNETEINDNKKSFFGFFRK